MKSIKLAIWVIWVISLMVFVPSFLVTYLIDRDATHRLIARYVEIMEGKA